MSCRGLKPEWRLAAMNDPNGRRGIWFKGTPTGGVEICAGREGDDYHVQLKPGEVLSPVQLYQLLECLEVGAWMVKDYPPPGLEPPEEGT